MGCHRSTKSSFNSLPLFSLVNVLGANQFSEDVVPTVAFNLRQVRKGNVVMKIWDVAVSPFDFCGLAKDLMAGLSGSGTAKV